MRLRPVFLALVLSSGVAGEVGLGRRVAVLHDGPLAAGEHDAAFDASALAPGVYVVSARVTMVGGRTWTDVQRVTVAR